MKTWKKLLVVLFVLAFASTAFAAGNKNDLAYLGTDELQSASSVAASDEIILVRGDIPMQGQKVSDVVGKAVVEVAIVDDTITAAETGKVFVVTVASKFQLPAAADGLTYTFVTGSNVELEVQINTTPDTITFAPPEIGNGNAVIETNGTNTTGNTVTVYCDGSTWYVSVPYSATSAWTDGGEWVAL